MVLHLYREAIQFQQLLTSGLMFILDLTGGFQFLIFLSVIGRAVLQQRLSSSI